MYRTVADFITEWKKEADLTQRILDSLTDESLQQQVYPEGRTLGRIAWHFVTNIPEYLSEFGLVIEQITNSAEVPAAKQIAETFKLLSSDAAKAVEEQWTDETLTQVQNAFGRQESNATIFMGLIKHIVHHRGQVTVLMRQAGLNIPAVYGPSKEGWIQMGVEHPPL
ncbi:DinB family protein [Paenibacillus sp. Y412MC10]|uniref:DinB family protein n=1 Tax=Geobacillus sp. (strain Y412MC10) TaxID=481743 RepID=UPI0001787F5D|nr:DinB family protein [Paenibacillus sp. Y412MC10]ACX65175.1 DinB family protein [Paenibacillus sp. Y412MC10]